MNKYLVAFTKHKRFGDQEQITLEIETHESRSETEAIGMAVMRGRDGFSTIGIIKAMVLPQPVAEDCNPMLTRPVDGQSKTPPTKGHHIKYYREVDKGGGEDCE